MPYSHSQDLKVSSALIFFPFKYIWILGFFFFWLVGFRKLVFYRKMVGARCFFTLLSLLCEGLWMVTVTVATRCAQIKKCSTPTDLWLSPRGKTCTQIFSRCPRAENAPRSVWVFGAKLLLVVFDKDNLKGQKRDIFFVVTLSLIHI